MKSIIKIISIILLSISVNVYSSDNNSGRPCYDVNVQINRDNQARVKQDCDINISRTAQAGQNNSASTVQQGNINSNEVRQYEFNAAPRRRH